MSYRLIIQQQEVGGTNSCDVYNRWRGGRGSADDQRIFCELNLTKLVRAIRVCNRWGVCFYTKQSFTLRVRRDPPKTLKVEEYSTPCNQYESPNR